MNIDTGDVSINSVSSPENAVGSEQGTGADAIEHFDGSGASGRYSNDEQLGWIELTKAGIDKGHADYLRNNIGDGNGRLNAAEIDEAVEMLYLEIDPDSGAMKMTDLGKEAAASGLSPQEFSASQSGGAQPACPSSTDSHSNQALPSSMEALVSDREVMGDLIKEGLENPDTLLSIISEPAKKMVANHIMTGESVGEFTGQDVGFGELVMNKIEGAVNEGKFTEDQLVVLTQDNVTLQDMMTMLYTPEQLAAATSDGATSADILAPLYESESDYEAASAPGATVADILKPFYSADQLEAASSQDASLTDILEPFYSPDQLELANHEDATIADVLQPFYPEDGYNVAHQDDATMVDILLPLFGSEQGSMAASDDATTTDFFALFANEGNLQAISEVMNNPDAGFTDLLRASLG